MLTEDEQGHFQFEYDMAYLSDPDKPAVSLTLPKTQRLHTCEYLFPFFFNMLSEGANRKLQSRLLKIDEKDHFGILMATAGADTIGAITVKKVSE